jgi:hypothetical protein
MYCLSPLSKATHVHVASTVTAQIVAEAPANQIVLTHINVSSNNDNITSDSKMNKNSSNSEKENEFDGKKK